jgi:hypothetical protein
MDLSESCKELNSCLISWLLEILGADSCSAEILISEKVLQLWLMLKIKPLIGESLVE